jgi:hypothetical protein
MKRPNRQRQMAKQRRQAKRRQRTATRPVPALDDGRPEAAWLRVPASKGGPGGGVAGLMRHGLVLAGTGRTAEARRCFLEAKRKAPREPELCAYLATCSMYEGDFSGDVWPDVRHVYQGQLTQYRQPVWDGAPHPDQTLMIWDTCSGYGDTFQICRLWTKAKAAFQGRVVCGVPPGSTRLLSSVAGPDVLVEPPFEREPFDYHCPVDLLPGIPGCELMGEAFGEVPYAHADSELVAKWAHLFEDKRKIHVGLHWQADQRHIGAKYRKMPFSDFEPILSVWGARFYSLQYGGAAEVAKYPKVVDLGNVDSPSERFVQTAAILKCLDLVIAVDSGPAHLAGSLGVPTWLLLDISYDPRWTIVREDSTPFYPQHRLWRASNIGGFTGMIGVVAAKLRYAILSLTTTPRAQLFDGPRGKD